MQLLEPGTLCTAKPIRNTFAYWNVWTDGDAVVLGRVPDEGEIVFFLRPHMFPNWSVILHPTFGVCTVYASCLTEVPL